MKYFPIVLAMLILGAHFMRDGQLVVAVLIAAAPLLLLTRQKWSRLLLQAMAYIGTLIWLHTAFELTRLRMAMGAPWLRMLVILLAVAAVTLVAGLLLRKVDKAK